ncbi:MAG: glycosyltransferase, partial [Pseudomonadales bacterium]|nr:glycosyltransferase [Pseudomonadales bacterium]
MKKLAVLLSTYNGEKYLSIQLESLLAQKDISLTLFVRDDGSSDTTPNLLARFAAQHNNIHLRLEKNIGVIASFFDLMTTVDDNFDYYAFADQDDYWLPEKLISAVNKLEQQSTDKPLLYCSALEF